MKATVDIADSLLEEARELAARKCTTVDALVEQGLQRVLNESKRAMAFRLRKATFKGNGLQPGIDSVHWECVRALAYER